MKIGHLIHLDGAGGGPEAVINLMRGIRDAGHGQVVFLGGKGRISAICGEWGIKCIRLPIDRKVSLPWGFVRLLRSLRRNRPDVLLIHGQWGGPVGAMAAWITGIKSVYITHWPAFYTDWTPWRTFRNAWAEWIPCRIAKRVVTLSPSAHYQYLFRGWADETKLVVIPNVFHPGSMPSAEEAACLRLDNKWEADKVHVVSVGRLADQKRVDWLLKAWRIVQGNCPHARLWIVGDGPEGAWLRQLAEHLGIEKSCRFLGARPRGIAYIAASDIVAMTTLYESFGYVACEAMVCGKPVVATAADGVRDAITNGVDGYLTTPGDEKALALRLEQLITHEAERRRLGEAGRVSAQRWDEGTTIQSYLKLLCDVSGEES